MSAPNGRRPWTAEEVRYVHELYATTPTAVLAAALGRSITSVSQRAHNAGLHKSAEYYATGLGSVAGPGGIKGRGGRYLKGHTSRFKGSKGLMGVHPKSRAHQFQKGDRSPSWVPIGTERVSAGGYLQRKVTESGYPRRDWISVHVLVWTQVNGPVPAQHVVVFRNGDTRDFRVENLELISRQELLQRNSLQRFPRELRDVIKLAAKARRLIQEAKTT